MNKDSFYSHLSMTESIRGGHTTVTIPGYHTMQKLLRSKSATIKPHTRDGDDTAQGVTKSDGGTMRTAKSMQMSSADAKVIDTLQLQEKVLRDQTQSVNILLKQLEQLFVAKNGEEDTEKQLQYYKSQAQILEKMSEHRSSLGKQETSDFIETRPILLPSQVKLIKFKRDMLDLTAARGRMVNRTQDDLLALQEAAYRQARRSLGRDASDQFFLHKRGWMFMRRLYLATKINKSLHIISNKRDVQKLSGALRYLAEFTTRRSRRCLRAYLLLTRKIWKRYRLKLADRYQCRCNESRGRQRGQLIVLRAAVKKMLSALDDRQKERGAAQRGARHHRISSSLQLLRQLHLMASRSLQVSRCAAVGDRWRLIRGLSALWAALAQSRSRRLSFVAASRNALLKGLQCFKARVEAAQQIRLAKVLHDHKRTSGAFQHWKANACSTTSRRTALTRAGMGVVSTSFLSELRGVKAVGPAKSLLAAAEAALARRELSRGFGGLAAYTTRCRAARETVGAVAALRDSSTLAAAWGELVARLEVRSDQRRTVRRAVIRKAHRLFDQISKRLRERHARGGGTKTMDVLKMIASARLRTALEVWHSWARESSGAARQEQLAREQRWAFLSSKWLHIWCKTTASRRSLSLPWPSPHYDDRATALSSTGRETSRKLKGTQLGKGKRLKQNSAQGSIGKLIVLPSTARRRVFIVRWLAQGERVQASRRVEREVERVRCVQLLQAALGAMQRAVEGVRSEDARIADYRRQRQIPLLLRQALAQWSRHTQKKQEEDADPRLQFRRRSTLKEALGTLHRRADHTALCLRTMAHAESRCAVRAVRVHFDWWWRVARTRARANVMRIDSKRKLKSLSLACSHWSRSSKRRCAVNRTMTEWTRKCSHEDLRATLSMWFAMSRLRAEGKKKVRRSVGKNNSRSVQEVMTVWMEMCVSRSDMKVKLRNCKKVVDRLKIKECVNVWTAVLGDRFEAKALMRQAAQSRITWSLRLGLEGLMEHCNESREAKRRARGVADWCEATSLRKRLKSWVGCTNSSKVGRVAQQRGYKALSLRYWTRLKPAFQTMHQRKDVARCGRSKAQAHRHAVAIRQGFATFIDGVHALKGLSTMRQLAKHTRQRTLMRTVFSAFKMEFSESMKCFAIVDKHKRHRDFVRSIDRLRQLLQCKKVLRRSQVNFDVAQKREFLSTWMQSTDARARLRALTSKAKALGHRFLMTPILQAIQDVAQQSIFVKTGLKRAATIYRKKSLRSSIKNWISFVAVCRSTGTMVTNKQMAKEVTDRQKSTYLYHVDKCCRQAFSTWFDFKAFSSGLRDKVTEGKGVMRLFAMKVGLTEWVAWSSAKQLQKSTLKAIKRQLDLAGCIDAVDQLKNLGADRKKVRLAADRYKMKYLRMFTSMWIKYAPPRPSRYSIRVPGQDMKRKSSHPMHGPSNRSNNKRTASVALAAAPTSNAHRQGSFSSESSVTSKQSDVSKAGSVGAMPATHIPTFIGRRSSMGPGVARAPLSYASAEGVNGSQAVPSPKAGSGRRASMRGSVLSQLFAGSGAEGATSVNSSAAGAGVGAGHLPVAVQLPMLAPRATAKTQHSAILYEPVLLTMHGDFRYSNQRDCLRAADKVRPWFVSTKAFKNWRLYKKRHILYKESILDVVWKRTSKFFAKFRRYVAGRINRRLRVTEMSWIRPNFLSTHLIKTWKMYCKCKRGYRAIRLLRHRKGLKAWKHIHRIRTVMRNALLRMESNKDFQRLCVYFREWSTSTMIERSLEQHQKATRERDSSEMVSWWVTWMGIRHKQRSWMRRAVAGRLAKLQRSVIIKIFHHLDHKYRSAERLAAAHRYYINYCRRSVLNSLLLFRRNRIAQNFKVAKKFSLLIFLLRLNRAVILYEKALMARGSRVVLRKFVVRWRAHLRQGKHHMFVPPELRLQKVLALDEWRGRRSLRRLVLAWKQRWRRMVRREGVRLMCLEHCDSRMLLRVLRIFLAVRRRRRKVRTVMHVMDDIAESGSLKKAVHKLDSNQCQKWAGRQKLRLMGAHARRAAMRRGLCALLGRDKALPGQSRHSARQALAGRRSQQQ